MDISQTALSDTSSTPVSPSTSQLDDDALFFELKKKVTSALTKTNDWRVKARDEFAFVAGPGQWKPEEVQLLTDQMRPVVTFNKTLKFIKALAGVEANNRREVVFLPRDLTNVGQIVANETLSMGSDWMSDGCDATAEQSRAFRDCTICGMGWTEGAIEYDVEPRGAYVEKRLPPIEMFWDTSATDANIRSSKFRGRVRLMTLDEARGLVPGVTDDPKFLDEDLDATWAAGLIEKMDEQPKTQEQKEKREENTLPYNGDTEVHIVQIQWWEYENYFRTVDLRDPNGRTTIDVTADQMKQLESELGQPLPKAKLRRKVYKEAMLGGKLLVQRPCKRADGFTLNCVTWEPDDSTGMWFGIARVLKDPQEWSNKFFSQLMHMINATARGGIMAEKDAFDDIRQAEASWARHDKITVVANGALGNGKIQPKPGAAITAGVQALLELADNAFGDCSGINLELLGLADRDQAGVLEAQRKQAAMTILATLFDGLTGFHKDVGAMRLYFLQKYLADDRIIRIKGNDGYNAVQLIREQVQGSFDVIVDDAPNSPHAKEKAWASLQPIMPMIAQSKPAVAAVLDYIPNVPERLILIFKKILGTPDPALIDKQQADKDEQQSIIDKNNAASQAAQATAVLNLARAGVEHSRQAATDFAALMQAAAARRMAPGLVNDAVIMASSGFQGQQPNLTPRPAPAAPQPMPPAAPAPAGQPSGVVPPGGI